MTDTPETGDRIAKVMARAGVASRRDAERLIVEGRVSVNGKKVTSPALDILPGDRVTLDGKPIDAPQPARLWLYYKPLGLVTSERDEKGRQTVFESLPDGMPRVMSVGRLDLNSEGLLLLTNDGELKRKLELPSTGWLRKYRVRVNGRPNAATFDPLKRGITIDGEDFQPMEIMLDRQQGANAWLTVGLREGKNREIRRAMAEVGLTVNRLIRVSYGPFRLNEMKPGEVIEVKARVLREQLGEKTVGAGGGGEAGPRGGGDRPARKPGAAPRDRGERSDGRGGERGMERGADRREDRGAAKGERKARSPEHRFERGLERGPERGADRRGGAPSASRKGDGFAPRPPRHGSADTGGEAAGDRPRKPRHPAGHGAGDGARRAAAGTGERRAGPQGDRPPRQPRERDGERPYRKPDSRRDDAPRAGGKREGGKREGGSERGRDDHRDATGRKGFGSGARSGGKGSARDGTPGDRPARAPKPGARAETRSDSRSGGPRSFGDRDRPHGKGGAVKGDRATGERGGFTAGRKPRDGGKGGGKGGGFKKTGGPDRSGRGPRPKPGGDKPRKG